MYIQNASSLIRLLRKERGLTQRDFGRLFGYSDSAMISMIECGKRPHAAHALFLKVCERYKIEVPKEFEKEKNLRARKELTKESFESLGRYAIRLESIELGEELRELRRKHHNMKLTAFASLLKVDPSVISRAENGRYSAPRIKRLIREFKQLPKLVQ
jgi:transcriptional regulator with XRE-family HTH domain